LGSVPFSSSSFFDGLYTLNYFFSDSSKLMKESADLHDSIKSVCMYVSILLSARLHCLFVLSGHCSVFALIINTNVQISSGCLLGKTDEFAQGADVVGRR